MKRKQYSLTESRLKEVAQEICRSNLYDHQARGRSAFACIEKLMERSYVRVEHLPGRTSTQEGKYSLLRDGEALAKYCYEFQQEVQANIEDNPKVTQCQVRALRGDTGTKNPIKLVVDSREDKTYVQRLIDKCRQQNIACEQRELPAGDYLFVVGSDQVCPLVIERKSWSDLADSVTGKGRRRLDCVKLGSDGQRCEGRRCQLCKMKASGCSRIMFVIEGARCANGDDAPNKCTTTKRCQFCQELQQRHGRGVTQETLEEVLDRLRADHGCFVHFSRSYNDTIKSLLTSREILLADMKSGRKTQAPRSETDDISRAIALSLGNSSEQTPDNVVNHEIVFPDLSYQEFCANARNTLDTADQHPGPVKMVEWDDSGFVGPIFQGNIEAACNNLFQSTLTRTATTLRADSRIKSVGMDNVIDLESDQEDERKVPASCSNQDVIILESDNEEEVLVLGTNPGKRRKNNVSLRKFADIDEVELVLQVKPQRNAGTVVAGPNTSNADIYQRGDQPQLLLLSGLIQYDTEYFRDLSTVWKGLYRANKGADSAGSQFRSLCRAELRKVARAEVPLVARSARLFWLLLLQIRHGIQVHVTRQIKCKERLKSRLRLVSSVGVHVDGTAATSRVSTKSRSEQTCAICRNALGKVNVDATPCMHCFHSKCLDDWLSRQTEGNRRCPLCNHALGSFDQHIGKNRSESNQNHQPPRVASARDADLERLRAARLARFGNHEVGRAPASLTRGDPVHTPTRKSSTGYQDDQHWDCSQCTFRNHAKARRCEACQSWSCRQCTYHNSADASLCVACGTQLRSKEAALLASPTILSGEVDYPKLTSRPRKPAIGQHTVAPSRMKCGACGQSGHNRGTATAENCPKYFDEDEVKRRAKKKEESERKARSARDAIAQHQRQGTDMNTQLQEARRVLSNLEQAAAVSDTMRQNEVKRLERQKSRAEKQARKYNP